MLRHFNIEIGLLQFHVWNKPKLCVIYLDIWTEHLVVSLQNDQQMCQGTSGFYCVQMLPRHVSARGCHLKGVVGALSSL
jgi:hypothetical protein